MWVQLRWGLLALFVSLISPCLLRVQSQECVDQSTAVSQRPKKIKINIVGVEFRGENSPSDAARTKLAETIQRSEIEVSPEEPDTHWANALRAQTINEPLHAQGYFMASTEVTPYLVKAEPDQLSYIVSFTIENGRQYRVGTLQIALDFRRCPGHKIPFPPVKVSAPIWGKSQLMLLPDRRFQVSDKR